MYFSIFNTIWEGFTFYMSHFVKHIWLKVKMGDWKSQMWNVDQQKGYKHTSHFLLVLIKLIQTQLIN